jgi:hypothetical protein
MQTATHLVDRIFPEVSARQNPDELKQLADVDRVIHEPARLPIVTLIAGVKVADFLLLQRESGLTRGNLSSHLAKLEQAAYVEIRKTYNASSQRNGC